MVFWDILRRTCMNVSSVLREDHNFVVPSDENSAGIIRLNGESLLSDRMLPPKNHRGPSQWFESVTSNALRLFLQLNGPLDFVYRSTYDSELVLRSSNFYCCNMIQIKEVSLQMTRTMLLFAVLVYSQPSKFERIVGNVSRVSGVFLGCDGLLRYPYRSPSLAIAQPSWCKRNSLSHPSKSEGDGSPKPEVELKRDGPCHQAGSSENLDNTEDDDETDSEDATPHDEKPKFETVRESHTIIHPAFRDPIVSSLPYDVYRGSYPQEWGYLAGFTQDSFLLFNVGYLPSCAAFCSWLCWHRKWTYVAYTFDATATICTWPISPHPDHSHACSTHSHDY